MLARPYDALMWRQFLRRCHVDIQDRANSFSSRLIVSDVEQQIAAPTCLPFNNEQRVCLRHANRVGDETTKPASCKLSIFRDISNRLTCFQTELTKK